MELTFFTQKFDRMRQKLMEYAITEMENGYTLEPNTHREYLAFVLKSAYAEAIQLVRTRTIAAVSANAQTVDKETGIYEELLIMRAIGEVKHHALPALNPKNTVITAVRPAGDALPFICYVPETVETGNGEALAHILQLNSNALPARTAAFFPNPDYTNAMRSQFLNLGKGIYLAEEQGYTPVSVSDYAATYPDAALL